MPPDPVKSFLKVQEGDRQRSLGPLRPVNEVSIERNIVQDATPWYEASLCLTTEGGEERVNTCGNSCRPNFVVNVQKGDWPEISGLRSARGRFRDHDNSCLQGVHR